MIIGFATRLDQLDQLLPVCRAHWEVTVVKARSSCNPEEFICLAVMLKKCLQCLLKSSGRNKDWVILRFVKHFSKVSSPLRKSRWVGAAVWMCWWRWVWASSLCSYLVLECLSPCVFPLDDWHVSAVEFNKLMCSVSACVRWHREVIKGNMSFPWAMKYQWQVQAMKDEFRTAADWQIIWRSKLILWYTDTLWLKQLGKKKKKNWRGVIF